MTTGKRTGNGSGGTPRTASSIRPATRTSKVAAPRAGRAGTGCVKVMVALAGIGGTGNGARGRARGEQYRSMRALAQERRDDVVAWLAAQDLRGEYKGVSQPTAFGTFTLECTPDVMRLLRRAPHVESVTRVGDTTLDLLAR